MHYTNISNTLKLNAYAPQIFLPFRQIPTILLVTPGLPIVGRQPAMEGKLEHREIIVRSKYNSNNLFLKILYVHLATEGPL